MHNMHVVAEAYHTTTGVHILRRGGTNTGKCANRLSQRGAVPTHARQATHARQGTTTNRFYGTGANAEWAAQ